MKTIDAIVKGPGPQLAVRDWGGSGLPLLLLPGGGCTVADLEPLARVLMRNHRVVGMDLRNHGRSQDGAWGWDLMLDDVDAVIRHFGFERVVPVGHSLGGMLAVMCAGRGGRCIAAVNLDGQSNPMAGPDNHYLFDGMPAAQIVAWRAKVDALERAAFAAPPTMLDRAQLDAMQAAQTPLLATFGIDPELAGEMLQRRFEKMQDGRFLMRPAPAQTKELMDCIHGLDLFMEYRRCSVPLLVVHAQRNGAMPDAESTAMADAMRRGLSKALARIAMENRRVQVVEVNATHALTVEMPDELASYIGRFTAGL